MGSKCSLRAIRNVHFSNITHPHWASGGIEGGVVCNWLPAISIKWLNFFSRFAPIQFLGGWFQRFSPSVPEPANWMGWDYIDDSLRGGEEELGLKLEGLVWGHERSLLEPKVCALLEVMAPCAPGAFLLSFPFFSSLPILLLVFSTTGFELLPFVAWFMLKMSALRSRDVRASRTMCCRTILCYTNLNATSWQYTWE